MEEPLAYYEKAVKRSGYMILLYLLQYFIPAFPPHYSVYEEMASYYRRMEVSLSRLGSFKPLTRRRVDWDAVKPLDSLPGACLGVVRASVHPPGGGSSLGEQVRLLPLSPYVALAERLRGSRALEVAYYAPLAATAPAPRFTAALYDARYEGYEGPPGMGRLKARVRDIVVYDAAYPVRIHGACFEPIDKCIVDRWKYALDTVLGLAGDVRDLYFDILIKPNIPRFKSAAREKVFSRALRDYMGIDMDECFSFNTAHRCGPLSPELYPYHLVILSAHMQSPVLKELKLFQEAWPNAVAARLEYLHALLPGGASMLRRLYKALMPRPPSAFRRALYSLVSSGVMLGSYVGYCVRCEPQGRRISVELRGADSSAVKLLASAMRYVPVTPVIYYSTKTKEAWFTGMVSNVKQLRILLGVAERKGLLEDFKISIVEDHVEYTLPFEMYSPASHQWVVDNTSIIWEMHYASLQAWCRRILRCYEASHRGGAAKLLCRAAEEAPRRFLGRSLRELEASRTGLI